MSQTQVQLVGNVTTGGVFAGVVTATAANIGGGAVGINSTGINATGVVTATSFYGDGSQLTGVGGVGQPTGDADRLFNYVAAAATITQSITFDETNSGNFNSYVISVVPNITIASGVGVTIGVGKTTIIDVLNLAGLTTSL